LLKVAAFASIYHVRTGFHGATDLSPVTLAAATHFGLAVNNFGIQEYMPHAPVVHDVFKVNYRCEAGHLRIDDTPGIGVDIDDERASRYPYAPAALPVNRTLDGTLFHW
jgi:mannonate dehydratase